MCNYVIAIIKYSITKIHHISSLIHIVGIVLELQIAHGFSVLLQFADTVQVEWYTEAAYNIANRSYPPYFQIRFYELILVNLTLEQSSFVRLIYLKVSKEEKRGKKSMKKMQKRMR